MVDCQNQLERETKGYKYLAVEGEGRGFSVGLTESRGQFSSERDISVKAPPIFPGKRDTPPTTKRGGGKRARLINYKDGRQSRTRLDSGLSKQAEIKGSECTHFQKKREVKGNADLLQA